MREEEEEQSHLAGGVHVQTDGWSGSEHLSTTP